MAKVGAQRAAVLTGKSKSTIQRAMNSGKLSYELDQNKRRIIDVSELERVFGIKQTAAKKAAPAVESTNSAGSQDIESAVERERMLMQIKMLEQQLVVAGEHIDDLKDQRDKWEKQASQVLITSQYSQRQAEELRAQIKEREERARQRRLQNAKVQNVQQQVGNRTALPPSSRSVPPASPSESDSSRIDSRMQRLKAQNENRSEDTGSVFRFWKKAKG